MRVRKIAGIRWRLRLDQEGVATCRRCSVNTWRHDGHTDRWPSRHSSHVKLCGVPPTRPATEHRGTQRKGRGSKMRVRRVKRNASRVSHRHIHRKNPSHQQSITSTYTAQAPLNAARPLTHPMITYLCTRQCAYHSGSQSTPVRRGCRVAPWGPSPGWPAPPAPHPLRWHPPWNPVPLPPRRTTSPPDGHRREASPRASPRHRNVAARGRRVREKRRWQRQRWCY